MIAVGLVSGIVMNFRHVYQIHQEYIWLKSFEEGRDHFPGVPCPKILAPLTALSKNLNINAGSSRYLLESIEGRLEDRRYFSRYLMGVLIFLGLLGTFWGLSQTIGSVAHVISGLDISAQDVKGAIENLKIGLQSPLKGMGTAFSCSLFGLSSSLVIGFLDLRIARLFTFFFHDIEESLTPTSALPVPTTSSGSAFSMALLEQMTEIMSLLQSQLARNEENRADLVKSLQTLTEQIQCMTDQTSQQQMIVKKVAQNQIALQENTQDFIKESQKSNGQIQNLHTTLNRLLEESIDGRVRMTQELKNEVRLVAKTLSAIANGQEIAA